MFEGAMGATAQSDYYAFLAKKMQAGSLDGFNPLWIPDFLFGFQSYLVDWSLRTGRSALMADCGLGKSPMQLVWAENVVRHTNKPVLVMTPLGVSAQTVREAAKFGIDAVRSRDGKFKSGARIVVTNYEKLHFFNPSDFGAAVGDESGSIKNFDGERTGEVIEFFRTLRYRLLCSATAAPNDFIELGTHSESLGYMGYMDMLSRFFKNDQNSNHPNRKWTGGGAWRFRGHAQDEFWRWVCSWARACRKPSDLGFSDEGYDLPPLVSREHVIHSRTAKLGHLFDKVALNRQEQLEVRRRTMPERCEKVAEIINGNGGKPAVAWCQLNPEGDLLERLIDGAVQVAGKDSDERKEEVFEAFTSGEILRIVTKGRIGGWGLNWQHCAHMTSFPTHSFEEMYQEVRRFWRFGQTSEVHHDMVCTDGDMGVLANLQRKSEQADVMFARMIDNMNDPLRIAKREAFQKDMTVPTWL